MMNLKVLRIADAILHHEAELLTPQNLIDMIRTADQTYIYITNRMSAANIEIDRLLPYTSPLYALNANKAPFGYYSMIYHRGRQIPISVDLRVHRIGEEYTNNIRRLHPSATTMSSYFLDNIDPAINHINQHNGQTIDTFMAHAFAIESNAAANHYNDAAIEYNFPNLGSAHS